MVHPVDECPIQSVLNTEIDRLRREVSQDVCPVASPEGEHTLLLHASREAVENSFIRSLDELGIVVLSLKEQLDSLDRRRYCLGNGS